MAAVVGRQWKMFKIDFENVFLDVDLEKEVYVALSVSSDPLLCKACSSILVF